MNRSRTYESGSSKRKRKAIHLEQKKMLEGSLLKYTKKMIEDEKGSNLLIEKKRNDATMENFDENISNQDTDERIQDPVSETKNDYINAEADDNLIRERCDEGKNSEPSTSNAEKYSDDPALWTEITDTLREHILQNPPTQHMEFSEKSERLIGNKKRYFTSNHLYRVKQNKEKIRREWLTLSPSTGAVFCWICKLFSKMQTALSSSSGFCDWKHATERLREHENSHPHREAVCVMLQRTELSSRIDRKIAENNSCESKYWFDVLRRVVAVTKFLASRGMPFYGQNETVGSVENGNFLGCLEVISEFDPFLAEHLKARGNPGTGHTSYLSSTTVDEFVSLMGKKVSDIIISEIKSAKYYSIIVDSTPDLSHTDQLTFVFRYVSADCEPIERFFQFIPIRSHSAEHLEETVTSLIENVGLDILNCRGQSYDNASNMAGKYSGLQARIKAISPHAVFIPCAAHSLNLVIVKSVEINGKMLDFFNFLQKLYNFFSSSTYRWGSLQEKIKESKGENLTLKSRSNTRWCANAAATKALRKHYKYIICVLLKMAENAEESPATRHEACALHKKLQKFETALFCVMWDSVLNRVDSVSKSLQSPSLNLSQVPDFFSALISFIEYVRNSFDIYESEASILVGHSEYSSSRNRKIPKYFCDGPAEEMKFTDRANFKVSCFYVMCDSLTVQLNQRMSAYSEVLNNFACLFDTDKQTAYENAKKLSNLYPTDLEEDFVEEFIHIFPLIQKQHSIEEKLKKITNLGINDTFANVHTALKLFLTLPISNCTGERSFSLLKRIKSPLRTSVTNEKLSALSLLAIESDITKKLDFNDVIHDFVQKKVRRKIIKNHL